MRCLHRVLLGCMCIGKMGEDRGGHISLINFSLAEFYRRNVFVNAKGRVKEDGAFKFYEQVKSLLEET